MTDPAQDLRDRLADVLRTTPSVLMDTPEDRARHADNPRNHHIEHHYYWGCAMCRGEVDTLADAALGIIQHELESLEQQAQNAAAVARQADAVAGRATKVIVAMGADFRQMRGQCDRYRSAWLSARQRAEAYGEGILRHVEDRDTWKGWERQQAVRAQTAEAELAALRDAARSAAVLLRATADRPSTRAVLLAAAGAIDNILKEN